ncbi:glycosyl hydrolase YngK-like [Physella acuta]|uniref:glycosyl hydrolase YngK-like n=1 Tax=Physella acuta TaxID=109671 RepID=UPI0027DB0AC9|nr:glycosyl hydrolase YngK-like [Physella acuta]
MLDFRVFVLLFGVITPVYSACSQGRTKHELRGAWIATVSNIDWPKSSSRTTSQNQADLISLLDTLASQTINAVFFQVRPVGDAFYASTIEPWSQYLTGTQGHAPSPSWDPLQFLITEAHKRSIEVHAWINPYRAKSGSTTTTGLAANHMAKAFTAHAHAYGNNLWMDPGSTDVQNRCNDVVMDIVRRYDVDGIHMDDYFYPYPTSASFPDTSTYNAYKNGGGTLAIADWRRDNVNKQIERLSNNIHQAKPWVKFGISPFGIWKSGQPSGVTGTSSVDALYADSRLWLQKGWLDYIAPQLYWVIDGPQSFTKLLDWWSDPAQNPLHKHVYAGLADYRILENNWSVNEILHQIQITQIRTSHDVWGAIHFSAKDVETNVHGLFTTLKSSVYKNPSVLPAFSFRSGVPAPAAPRVTASGATLDWSGSNKDNVRSWAVYQSTATTCQLVKVLGPATTSYAVPGTGDYVVTAVNRLGAETDGNTVTISTVVG